MSSVQDNLALAELAELSHDLRSLTTTVERLATGITNHVLFAGTVRLDQPDGLGAGGGFYTFTFSATCGSLEVHNTTESGTLVVTPGAANVQPIAGPGCHYVQAGTWRTVNVDRRTVTIWGPVNTLVGVQALTVGGIIGGGTA